MRDYDGCFGRNVSQDQLQIQLKLQFLAKNTPPNGRVTNSRAVKRRRRKMAQASKIQHRHREAAESIPSRSSSVSRIYSASNHLSVPSRLYKMDHQEFAHLAMGRSARSSSQSATPTVSSNFKIPSSTTEYVPRTESRLATRNSAPRSESRMTTREDAPRSESRQSSKFNLRALKSKPTSRRTSVGDESEQKSKTKSKSRNPFKSKKTKVTPTISTSIISGPTISTQALYHGQEDPENWAWVGWPEVLPPFERRVDLVATADDIEDTTLFMEEPYIENRMPRKFRVHRLPASVRRNIYQFCFPIESRKISLSPRFTTKAVFGEDYFASPWDILDDLWGGLGSFNALRKDLLTYFWTNYHFHVTLSLFSGPRFCPLSLIWLPRYLGIIQYLTVEVDFTTFRHDCMKVAPDLGYCVHKEEKLLMNLVEGLSDREGGAPMAELHLLCRCYEGFHPHQDPDFIKKFGKNPVPYFTEKSICLYDAVCTLQGTLKKLRMAGFPLEYTEALLSITCRSDEPHKTPPEPAWPPSLVQSVNSSFESTQSTLYPLPKETSFTSTSTTMSSSEQTTRLSSPENSFDSIESISEESAEDKGLGIRRLDLPRSRSFVDEFEDGIRSSSSTYSNYTLAVGKGVEVEEEQTPKCLLPRDSVAIPEYAKQYQELLFPISSPEIGDSTNANSILSPKTTPYVPATPRSPHVDGLHTPRRVPSFGNRELTPNKLNELNERNERDPAFLRTLEAFRGLDPMPPETPQMRCNSALASARPESRGPFYRDPPARCVTSLGSNRKGQGNQTSQVDMNEKVFEIGAVKNKFSSFLSKLRG